MHPPCRCASGDEGGKQGLYQPRVMLALKVGQLCGQAARGVACGSQPAAKRGQEEIFGTPVAAATAAGDLLRCRRRSHGSPAASAPLTCTSGRLQSPARRPGAAGRRASYCLVLNESFSAHACLPASLQDAGLTEAARLLRREMA